MLIYTVVMPPIGIYPDFLLLTDDTMVDVLVVQIQILYYIYNILLLLTKQKLEFICGINNMIMVKQNDDASELFNAIIHLY